ncbi:MAG TPA: signal peptidase I [Terriglobia bacterium]|nr:signal peptidase I [Terriglobia bacterium]
MGSSDLPTKSDEPSQDHGLPVFPPSRRPARHEGLWETVRSLLIVLIGVFCIRTFVAEATVIPTGSMENTILIGDHVFLNKLLYGPQLPYTDLRVPRLKGIHREDIVAFRYPRNPSVMFVKRVIGVGGDVIRIVNKKVYVNGKLLREPYARFESPNIFPLRDNFPPPVREISMLPESWGLDPAWAGEMPHFIHKDGLHVPKGYLFVLGDNRDNSLDSRFWGFVPLPNVVGEPLFVYWSYDAPTQDWIDDHWSDRLKFDASILWNFVDKTRWSRLGKGF